SLRETGAYGVEEHFRADGFVSHHPTVGSPGSRREIGNPKFEIRDWREGPLVSSQDTRSDRDACSDSHCAWLVVDDPSEQERGFGCPASQPIAKYSREKHRSAALRKSESRSRQRLLCRWHSGRNSDSAIEDCRSEGDLAHLHAALQERT